MSQPAGPEILFRNDQACVAVDERLIRKVLHELFGEAGFTAGEVSVVLIDGPTMHRLNREYLQHDYPTDVLSFLYRAEPPRLDGELIASGEYAVAEAKRYGWTAENELLLYLVHGALHLIGYDDLDPAAAELMRAREREVLSRLGLTPPGR